MKATGEAPAVVCHGQHATTFLMHAETLVHMHVFTATMEYILIEGVKTRVAQSTN